jgi:transposase
MQAIKESSTLRVGLKFRKPSPRIVYRYGKQDKQRREFLKMRTRNSFMQSIDEAQVAMEAGYCWQTLYDALKEKGYDVRLAHPLRVKALAESKLQQ